MRKAAPPRDVPPPLELLCLTALWSLEQGDVSQVRRVVGESKTLAYTTVMTLLERLTRKGMISRRKAGRRFIYTPEVTRQSMRRAALKEFVDCFFEGSREKLSDFLRIPEPPAIPEEAESEDRIETALL